MHHYPQIILSMSLIKQLFFSHHVNYVSAHAKSLIHPPQNHEIIYQNNVQLLDLSMETISIAHGEEPADVVYKFGLNHGLDQTQRQYLLRQICSSLDQNEQSRGYCTRDKAVIFSAPVNSEQNILIDHFNLLEGEEPVDVVHNFVRRYNLDLGYRDRILKQACEHVECRRMVPILWNYTVRIQEPSSSTSLSMHSTPVIIQLLEGQELADVIFHTLLPWNITRAQRKLIFDVAKAQGVASLRDNALVYQQNVSMNEMGDSWNATLTIWDDDTEPVDVVYYFLRNQSYHLNTTGEERDRFDRQWQHLSGSVLPHICNLLPCNRMQPRVWSYPITLNHGKDQVALLEFMKDEEPIDAIDRFASSHRLDNNYRQHLFNIACRHVLCRRNVPVVFEKTVQNEHGQNIGTVQVMENEEVVDAVVRFMRKLEPLFQIDPVVMKNSFFQLACHNTRLLCTRNVAHVFDKVILNQERSSKIGQLIITEFEEPADKIYGWIQQMNISLSYFDSLLEQVCMTEGVRCTRKKPVVFRLSLTDPTGNIVGQLEILMDEEPVDSVYRFFSMHRLFEKNWDFRAVVQQICKIPAITCLRNTAIKFFSENFVMGDDIRNVGRLLVWEHEEVIDKLYEKRIEHNLTLDDQMKSFSAICHSKNIYCSRTRAVVYKLSGITKRDYEKFGNETCSRKYAGWQYLASFAGSFLGSKLVPYMKQQYMTEVISHPLFSPCILFLMLMVTDFLIQISSPIKTYGRTKRSLVQKIVSFFIVFLFMSVFHACVVEPENAIDNAMHVYEGKLPDLVIFEGDEPVDVLLKWSKLAAKDHHPIVREPIYWDLLQKICSEIQFQPCRRKRAWHYIDMGTMTVSGQNYDITYLDRSVDPLSKTQCRVLVNKRYDSCVEEAALALCMRIQPQPMDCVESISMHIQKQLRAYRKKRFDSKDTYVKLGLEMDSPDSELFHKLASVVRSRGMNLVPFYPIDNGTAVFYKWDLPYREASVALTAFSKIKDPESRLWNDKPCTPYFGGALCAKMDKDGNMLIEV